MYAINILLLNSCNISHIAKCASNPLRSTVIMNPKDGQRISLSTLALSNKPVWPVQDVGILSTITYFLILLLYIYTIFQGIRVYFAINKDLSLTICKFLYIESPKVSCLGYTCSFEGALFDLCMWYTGGMKVSK